MDAVQVRYAALTATLGLAAASWVVAVRQMDGMDMGVATRLGTFAFFVALTEWGDRWAAPDGPPVLYAHSVCGGRITLQTTCAECGQVHDPTEIRVRPGPGMPAASAARTG